MKYHINGAGEAGKCSAQSGNCPFGGDERHYDSPEKARMAFELSMASSVVPSTQKQNANGPFTKVAPLGREYNTHLSNLTTDQLNDEIYRIKEGLLGQMSPSDAAARLKAVRIALKNRESFPALGDAYSSHLDAMTFNELTDEFNRVMAVDGADMTDKEAGARLKAISDAQQSYFERNYDGFTKEQLIFDREAYIRKLSQGRAWRDASREKLEKQADNAHASWVAEARTEPATSYEENVPIRLLPVGTEVHYPYAKGSPYRKVGTPVDNGPDFKTGEHDIVGKYHDGIQWDYVSPNTTFKLGVVPVGKNLSPRWNAINAKAARLRELREQVAVAMENGSL